MRTHISVTPPNKVLRLPRMDAHNVLRLPQNLHMDIDIHTA